MNQKIANIELADAQIGVFNIRNLRRADWAVVLLTAVLMFYGLLTLYHAVTEDDPAYHIHQLMAVPVGVFLILLLLCMDSRFLVSLAPVVFVLSLLLLGAVVFWGDVAKGGQHWLSLGPIRFQPSEFSKVALVYMLAWYLSRIRDKVRKLPWFLLTFVIAGATCGFILLQEDLGTMTVLLPLPFVMLLVAGCRLRHLAAVLLLGSIAAGFAAPAVWAKLKPYQRARLVAFIYPEGGMKDTEFRKLRANFIEYIYPELDMKETGYQLRQAQIAIGSGRLTGKGYGEKTHAHLQFVPEYHNDFIFAVLAEGDGFVGGIMAIGLFALLLVRSYLLAGDCDEMSSALLITGCTTVLAVHAFMTIAIPLGLMPVTGLPLPFFSYGRSFYLVTMLCIGTILSANVRRKGMFDS